MATKRPLFLVFIAVLSILTAVGIIALFVVLAVVSPTYPSDTPFIVCSIAFVLFRLATAISLLRLHGWARIVEQVYNWIKAVVLAPASLFLLVTRPEFGVPCAVLAWVSILVARYLRSADVRLLFSRGIVGLPEEERAAVEVRLRRTSASHLAAMILGTVAFAGFAIKAPLNLLDAIQRSNQKRTMAEMRTIGTALEARATDLQRDIPASPFTMPAVRVSAAELNRVLAPRYIKSIPAKDAWGHPYEFRFDAPLAGDADHIYVIRSFGRDGKANAVVEGATNDYDCDIVFTAGSFSVYPEGHSN